MQSSQSTLAHRFMFYIIATFALAWGIFVVHRPLLESAEYLHGDYGDGRLVILFLEHSYEYVFGSGYISDYWQSPWNFYPYPLTIAMSEPMAGNLFLYAPFRLAGMTMEAAAKYWVLTTSIANFAAGLVLFRLIGASALAAVIGAYLINFSMIRINHLNHLHLFPLYPALLAIIFGVLAFRIKTKLKFAAALLSGISVGWQFWCSLHIGWFLIFGLSLYSCALAVSSWSKLKERVLANWILLGIFTVGLVICFAPLYYKMMEFRISAEGTRTYDDVLQFMLRRHSFLMPAEGSLLYDNQFERMTAKLQFPGEQAAFAGYVALASALFSLPVLWWRRRQGQLLDNFGMFGLYTAIIFIFVCLITTKNFWGTEGWKLFYSYFPGTSGIRAIGRISIFINFMMAVLLAYWLSQSEKSRLRPVGWIVALFVLMENFAPALARFEVMEHRARMNKVEMFMASSCPPETKVYFSTRAPIDVNARTDLMWIGIETHKNIINGYSGYNPPGFTLNQNSNISAIQDWLQSQGIELREEQICVFDHP
jgi:hypothetical protein